MNRVAKTVGILAAIAAIAISLQACGRREPLKRPEGSTYPRQYPAP